MDEFERRLGMTLDQWLDRRRPEGLSLDSWETNGQPYYNLAYWISTGKDRHCRCRINVVGLTLRETVERARQKEIEIRLDAAPPLADPA